MIKLYLGYESRHFVAIEGILDICSDVEGSHVGWFGLMRRDAVNVFAEESVFLVSEDKQRNKKRV